MELDATFLSDGLGKLTNEDLPSPVYDLPTLVRAKAVPKKPLQMSTSINNFLRRDHRHKTIDTDPVGSAENNQAADAIAIQDDPAEPGQKLQGEVPPIEAMVAAGFAENKKTPADLGEPPTSTQANENDNRARPEPQSKSHDANEDTDHFSVLGLLPGADEQEIKTAYRRLMVQASIACQASIF